MASDSSFLPRILSVFYAVFHDNRGTNIVYQVPEGLILTAPVITPSVSGLSESRIATPNSNSEPSSTRTSASRGKSGSENNGVHVESASLASRASSVSRYSHLAESRGTLGSSCVRAGAPNPPLFKFEDISRYVIPPSALCGRLVTCTTRKHQVIGFPVELFNEKRYERNFFRFNVCFVFDRTADLSCYEPIVRKVGRVLTACEDESSILSSPETSHKIHAVLEQLYEDLNSYSETSIFIDKFNTIELKIFPFYPNPPEVHDWSVPVALINLKKRVEDNWDLTMAKVCMHIDGTNHVSRIAYLADCDLDLTRKAVQHLLFYQVIMMIDIFQFSNMYTLCRSISWLADEGHVKGECGPYVTYPDHELSGWPSLLHLYTRLKPGITVFEWMQEYNTHKHGIDPRRFVSFGVIKGFLRRVHRWPVLLPSTSSNTPDRDSDRSALTTVPRRRGKSLTLMTTPFPPSAGPSTGSLVGPSTPPMLSMGSSAFTLSNTASSANLTRRGSQGHGQGQGGPAGAGGAGKEVEGQGERTRTISGPTLARYSRNYDITGSSPVVPAIANALQTSPRAQRYSRNSGTTIGPDGRPRRRSVVGPTATVNSSSSMANVTDIASGDSGLTTPTRPRLSRSPSSSAAALIGSGPATNLGGMIPMTVPAGMKEHLDGTKHTDELGVLFEMGWPLLEKHLIAIGNGKGDGDFGNVEIIYC